LASEFGVTVDEVLFDKAPPAADRGEPSVADSTRAAPEPGLAVQRGVERPAIALNSGVKWERLMFWADEDVEFLEATYEPGGASSPHDAFVRHNGHEFGHILTGTLRIVVGFDEFILEPGDSITFPSSTPHRLSNEGTETVRAVWVVRGRRGTESAKETPDSVGKPTIRRVKTSSSHGSSELRPPTGKP
jgi:mannose-6-phosphate isomerase-like protein (cupin superfamily)